MPDPVDIRRRRDDAEQDEANYLLEQLRNGANLIQDDAAERSRRERESARLMGRPVAGDDNLLPQIGLSPALPSVVPEAFQGTDDRTMMELEGAEQMADESARERGLTSAHTMKRDAAQRALRALQAEREDPLVTTERGLNAPAMPRSIALAGDRSHRAYQNLSEALPDDGTVLGEMLDATPVVGEISRGIRALGRSTPEGVLEGYGLGHLDEIEAYLREPYAVGRLWGQDVPEELGGARFDEILSNARARRDVVHRRDPEGVALGSGLASAVLMALPGAGDVARSRQMGALGTGALMVGEGAGWGALAGSGESDAEMFSPGWTSDTTGAAGVGGLVSGLMYGVPRLAHSGYRGIRRMLANTPETMAAGAARLQEAAGAVDEGTAATARRFLAREAPPPPTAQTGPFGLPAPAAPRLPAPDTGVPYRASDATMPGRRRLPPRPSIDDAIQASERRVGELSPRDLRAAATRGSDSANRDGLLGEMSDSLGNLFRLGDEVEESVGRLQAKEATIRRAMGVDAPVQGIRNRAALTAQQVEEALGSVMEANGGVFSNRQRAEIQRLVDIASSAEDPAASFMALDSIKRQVGRLRGLAQNGRLGPNSNALADDLEALYGQLRGHLEDAGVWGNAAATIQREANAAYTPYIPARQALENRFMQPDPHRRAANGWDQAQRADRQRIAGLLDNANAAERVDERADLLRGAHQFSDWAGTMQRLYAGDDQAARQMAQESQRLLGLIERMQTDARAADMLRQVSESVGSLRAGPIRVDMPMVVRLLRRYADDPVAAAGAGGGRIFAAILPGVERAIRDASTSAGRAVVSNGRLAAEPARRVQPAATPMEPGAATGDPSAMTDEEWLRMTEQPAPAAQSAINPDELSDEEWLRMMEQ